MEDMTHLYNNLRENESLFLDNCAVLNITGDDGDNSILPEGLYNHLNRMHRILADRRRELRLAIFSQLNKFGHPVLLETGRFRPVIDTPGLMEIKILIPRGFDYSDECKKELDAVIQNTIFQIIEKYMNPQKEGE